MIVPVKGDDEGLRENLAALAALDYPDYELIVVAQSAADIPPGVLPARVKVVLAHGDRLRRLGEKCRTWRPAVRAARRRSAGIRLRRFRRARDAALAAGAGGAAGASRAWARPPATAGSRPIRPLSGR